MNKENIKFRLEEMIKDNHIELLRVENSKKNLLMLLELPIEEWKESDWAMFDQLEGR